MSNMKKFVGAGAHTRHPDSGRVGQFSQLLFKIANEPLEVKHKVHKAPQGPNKKLTDAQVLEARTLHEQEGWTPIKLQKKFDVSKAYMYCILSYQTRSRIYPKEK